MKEAVFNLAKSELLLGKLPEALSRCEKMLHEWPQYPPALSLLCVVLLLLGRRGESEALVERLRGMHFDCGDFLREYASEMSRGERPALAATILEFAGSVISHPVMGDSCDETERRIHAC
jgi:hypothetical protein